MSTEKQLTEHESLALITAMIQKVKASYHERGTSSILWGAVITTTSLVTYLQMEYNFRLPFDIWLLALIAIVPQIFISIQESKDVRVKRYQDIATNLVWTAYGISIGCLVIYQNIVPHATTQILKDEGKQLMMHYINNSKPDEVLQPFVPSMYSFFLMIYAFPTFVVGMLYKFKPMIIGAIITYGLFVVSCFTTTKIDMLLGAIAAISCWLIPGFILRSKYLAQKKNNV